MIESYIIASHEDIFEFYIEYKAESGNPKKKSKQFTPFAHEKLASFPATVTGI